MNGSNIRERLHRQIDELPDDVVEQIADFTLFVMARRELAPRYGDWDPDEWQTFVLEQFFRDGDEVEYSLDDAEEIYNP